MNCFVSPPGRGFFFAKAGRLKYPGGFFILSKLTQRVIYPGGKADESPHMYRCHAQRDGQDLSMSVQGEEVGRGDREAHASGC